MNILLLILTFPFWLLGVIIGLIVRSLIVGFINGTSLIQSLMIKKIITTI